MNVHQNTDPAPCQILRDPAVPGHCPGCKSLDNDPFFTLQQVPVDCSALLPTEHAALACKKARIDLVSCRDCGLIFNRSYDSSLLHYDEHYDNSLGSSPAFQRYARKTVARLSQTYSLEGKRIVEIGCGGGDFLRALCNAGRNHGTGYDPSSIESANETGDSVKVVRDYYSEAYASEPVDFLCCRHVLEHVESPFQFLCSLRRWLAKNNEVTFYFEVPNADFVFAGSGLWDIIYPHVCYFNLSTLERLFRRAGFEILDRGSCFGDQFIYIEARLHGDRRTIASLSATNESNQLSLLAKDFKTRIRKSIADWSGYLQSTAAARKRVAFWGAGAKGVTFLNLVSGASKIEYIVDSNTRKQGMHVPGTGQSISSPGHLREYQPDRIIALNPLYIQEISSTLISLGLNSEVVSSPHQ